MLADSGTAGASSQAAAAPAAPAATAATATTAATAATAGALPIGLRHCLCFHLNRILEKNISLDYGDHIEEAESSSNGWSRTEKASTSWFVSANEVIQNNITKAKE
jgi:hypothetical protein